MREIHRLQSIILYFRKENFKFMDAPACDKSGHLLNSFTFHPLIDGNLLLILIFYSKLNH